MKVSYDNFIFEILYEWPCTTVMYACNFVLKVFSYCNIWTKLQKIPDTLLGVVLGYAACSPLPKVDPDDKDYNRYPKIMNALSISFDGVGYGTTLARAFNWVCKMHNVMLCSPSIPYFRLSASVSNSLWRPSRWSLKLWCSYLLHPIALRNFWGEHY